MPEYTALNMITDIQNEPELDINLNNPDDIAYVMTLMVGITQCNPGMSTENIFHLTRDAMLIP